MKKNKPLLYDPLITNRVKQYLEENVDKTFLDVGVMTKQLQERYPEYTRRKNAPFRALVEQAYRIVSQSYGLESQPSSGDDSDGSDLEVMDDSSSNNLMSSMMNSLYSKPKAAAAAGGGGGGGGGTKQPASAEAIDISSDESGDEGRANGKTLMKNTGVAGVKTFRDVTLTKLAGGVGDGGGVTTALDHSSKSGGGGGSSSTSNTNDSTGIVAGGGAAAQAGQKRHDQSPAASAGQTVKKLKSDGGLATHNAVAAAAHQQQRQQHHAQQRHQQQQQLQRIANFNQNSNESSAGGHFAGNTVAAAIGAGAAAGVSAASTRSRKYKKEVQLRKSRESFQDIGGMEKTLKELCELLMHIKSPDIYFQLGLMPPRGILLHGPPGCGKTLLAHAIAGQLNLALIEIPATELIAGISGESEERIRDVFEQASACAPCVLFIDEVDAISSNRSMAQKDMERRIASQLISSLDNLKQTESGQSVLVIGATTRPDVLDPALRRVGRFDHEIAIGIPSRKDRKDILTIICDGLSVEQKCDFDRIAELTPGYVGADLLALVSRAATIAVKRKCSEQMRAFQVKAQRNITIVDLDDELDDTIGAEEAKKLAESPKEADNEATQGGKDVETAEANVTEPEEKSTETKEGENEIVAEEVTTDGTKKSEVNGSAKATIADAVAADADEGEQTETPEDEEMEVDEETNKSEEVKQKEEATAAVDAEAAPESKDDDAVTTDKVTDEEMAVIEADPDDAGTVDEPIAVTEPSLFELLNWLDNPPEDITFVGDFCITLDDFCDAVKVVQPSAKREGFITVPDVTWDDIGSLRDIREELKLAVLAPVKFPEKLKRLGLSAPSGVLLCGPPGCGKTLLAKAVANEAGINFISVKGPELMNMYVGESERAVRACFQRARNSSPCVIFFDEFDSLCPKRSDTNEGGSGTRVVNQLLTEMDGVEDRKGVYILAATNRPDIIDPAILRPGRLDTILYVGLPEQEERVEILKANTKNGTRPVLADDVDYVELSQQSDGYTGADLAGLVRQAAMLALKESINDEDSKLDDLCVRRAHFMQAFKLLRPSVTAQDRKVYEKLRLKFAAPRAPPVVEERV